MPDPARQSDSVRGEEPADQRREAGRGPAGATRVGVQALGVIKPLTVRFSPGTLSLISAKRTPQSPPQKMSLTICGTPVTAAGVIDHGTRGKSPAA